MEIGSTEMIRTTKPKCCIRVYIYIYIYKLFALIIVVFAIANDYQVRLFALLSTFYFYFISLEKIKLDAITVWLII